MGDDTIIIDQFPLGPMDNFLYILTCGQTKKAAAIDPAWDADYISQRAKDLGLEIVMVILTHGHPDHVNALDDFLKLHNVPAYISEHEAPLYTPNHKNIKTVKDKETLKVGKVDVECIHTPGHTPGGQCLKAGKHLITGDTLFIDGCGRCDLPGGDARVMYNTLYKILKKLPDELIIYPGHDYGPTPTATLGEQKRTNPYLLAGSEREFLSQRMGMNF